MHTLQNNYARSVTNYLITPTWYYHVGTSILLTLTLNLFYPHVYPAAKYLFHNLRRLWDRSCTCDHHRTKQVSQQALEAMYVPP